MAENRLQVLHCDMILAVDGDGGFVWVCKACSVGSQDQGVLRVVVVVVGLWKPKGVCDDLFLVCPCDGLCCGEVRRDAVGMLELC